jgi:predicted DNA-binding transcriptional regulator AlpA
MTKGTPAPEQTQGELFGCMQKSAKPLSPQKLNTRKTDPSKRVRDKSTAARFLSIGQVAERYGVGKSTVWRWVAKDKNFPEPIKLSKGTSRWVEHQLRDFEETAFIKTAGKKSRTAKGKIEKPVAGSPS